MACRLLKLVASDFKSVGFKVQLGQCSAIADSNCVSIGKIIKMLIDFGKNHGCRCSSKYVFLKFSQYSQENNLKASNFVKKRR